MRPTKNAWPTTDGAQGIKFFAQLMQQMLRRDAFESFRARSLDTLARVQELLDALDDVLALRIPQQALDPLLGEFEWSLRRDPVISKIASELVAATLQDKELLNATKTDVRKLRHSLIYLQKTIRSRYKNTVENEILEYFNNGKEKIRLRIATQFYCAFLLNSGYSRDFISEIISRRYFSRNHSRLDRRSLSAFFGEIDCEDKNFEIYSQISNEFFSYISRLTDETVIDNANIPSEIRRAFRLSPSLHRYDCYFYMKVKAKDEYSAARIVDRHLYSLSAMAFLGRKGVQFRWRSEKYARQVRANGGRLVGFETLRFQRTVSNPTAKTMKSLVSQSTQILRRFDEESTERLISSINTAALARTSDNIENQFISLWSAVEVLLSDPPPNTARIVHYANLIVPCICLKYARRYIIAVVDEIQIGYRSRLKQILATLPPELGIDAYTRFTHVIFDAQYQTQRSLLFDMVSDNPLAMHRIFKLGKDFAKPEDFLSSLKAHQQRVNWQIHRIYRARNHLVHAGRLPPFLESVVINLFEYYRNATMSVLNRASKEKERSSIDQVVREIAIELEMYKSFIASFKGGAFPADSFDRIFK